MRKYVNLHAELSQISLDDGLNFCPLGCAGVGEDREFHRLAAGIDQHPVFAASEARRAKQIGSSGERPWSVGNGGVDPELVPWRGLVPQGRCSAPVDERQNGIAIGGRGPSVSETDPAKPL